MKKATLFSLCISIVLLMSANSCGSNDGASPEVSGKGGSMARFAVNGNYLYTVDSRYLNVFDVSNAELPAKIKEVELGVDIETIFPYRNKLFIGSQSGMHIYDIAEPANPVWLSTYRHVTSCDPVVVQNDLAYVTLRTASECMRGNNQLDILDISNASSPKLLMSYSMQNPHGLGIDGNHLFLCEGTYGLKVFEITDPSNIKQVSKVEGLDAYDVIPSYNNLILTGKNGIYQFDYSQPQELKQRSKITTNNCR